MPYGETRIGDFDAFLQSSGVPISGVSQSADAPAGVTINFLPSATQEQIDFAIDARDNTFDWRRRRPLSRNAIVATIASLTQNQQTAIFRHLVAYVMRQNAAESANIASVLGQALPVDEVDPTEVVP